MKTFASFSLFVFRLVLTSALALWFQIFLIVRFPDYLLVVQDLVKQFSRSFFKNLDIDSSYQVAYNLINGDGLVVHTCFVLLAFTVLYVIFTPAKYLFKK
ncbi:MAG: hypothetical protein KTR18_04075 [Acidiferrobacterales bacterium]|nr:hypothetical protein [Acidiferrobacterales bacterium]